MKSGLAILLWSTGPERPELCASPFFYASAAAAMDVEVEIHFAGASVGLLAEGVAAGLRASDVDDRSILDHLRGARELGVKMLACTHALHARSIDRAALIRDVDGFAGAGAFVDRTLDERWATLVF